MKLGRFRIALLPVLGLLVASASAFAAPAKPAHHPAVKAAEAAPAAATASPTAPKPPAQAVRITYDMSDLPLTITVDKAGTAHIEELPYPGEVIYQPATGTVFYHHPEEEGWLSVPPSAIASLMVPNTIKSSGKGQPFNGQPTENWNVKTGTTTCDQWTGSPSAGTQTGLNVSDILRILTVVQWLNGGVVPNVCEKLDIPTATAQQVGLPVLFTGPNGRWQLQEVAADSSIATIEIPQATPLNDDARLRLLLVQFSPEERTSLITKFGSMPAAQQVEAISGMLNSETLP